MDTRGIVRKILALTLVMGLPISAPAQKANEISTTFRSNLNTRLQAALKQLKRNEPDIREVQKSALEFFRIDFDTVGSMRTRASWKSLMPTISGKYRRNDSLVDLGKWDFINYPHRKAGRDYVTFNTNEFEVVGSWDLSRLVFNPEVLDVASLVVLQEAVLKEITRIFYTRRRLQVDLILSPPQDAATFLSKELRVEELTATLDAMTGGLFSQTIDERTRSNEP